MKNVPWKTHERCCLRFFKKKDNIEVLSEVYEGLVLVSRYYKYYKVKRSNFYLKFDVM